MRLTSKQSNLPRGLVVNMQDTEESEAYLLLRQQTQNDEAWQNVMALNSQLDAQVEDMTTGMRRMLEKHEYEYLQAYNIFVKNKEKELKDFITEMESRSDDKKAMDLKIRKLETEKFKMHQKNYKVECTVEHLKAEISALKAKLKSETDEKEFFHKNAIESKKKLKLTKVALKRLQVEYDDLLKKGEKLKESLSLQQSLSQF